MAKKAKADPQSVLIKEGPTTAQMAAQAAVPANVVVDLDNLRLLATPLEGSGSVAVPVGQTLTLAITIAMPKELEPLGLDIQQMVADAANLSLTTNEQAESWSAVMVKVHKHQKKINDRRLEITRPIDALKKRVVALVQPMLDSLKELEEKIEKASVAYRAEVRRKAELVAQEAQRVEQGRAEEAQARTVQGLLTAGHEDEAGVLRAQPVRSMTVQPDVQMPAMAGVSFKRNWDYTIEEADIVPREYMMPDDAKIKARIKLFGDKHGIPGVLVFDLGESVGMIR